MKLKLHGCVPRTTVLPLTPARHGRRQLLLSVVSLALLGLSGCGPKRMKADFIGFEGAYAETSNREVLLNLARLQNHNPTYFFRLGQIQSSYRMQATVAGTANLTPQGTKPGGSIVAGGGSAGLIYENDPVFQFIPVNDDTNAQLLLKPIPAETFYILYQQGWRVDQLFRLLVDRIEITRPTKSGCEVETIRNQPPPVYLNPNGQPDKSYAHDPARLSSYVTFLRVSAVVYALQKHGLLLLRGTNTFVPFDKNSAISPASDKSAPQAKDQNDAIAKDTVWEKDDQGNWVLGRKVFTPVFYLNPLKEGEQKNFIPDKEKITAQITAELPELKNGPALDQALRILSYGFSIEGQKNLQEAPGELCPTSGISSHLVLRSMIGLMAAAAQEQIPYDALANSDPEIPANPHLPLEEQEKERPLFLKAVPRIEQLPLLRLTGNENEEMEPLIRVNYRGTTYAIADPGNPGSPDNQYWNRDMFRLISALTSEVTVDISKFPLPEILQLRTP